MYYKLSQSIDLNVIGKVRETQVSCWTPLQMRILRTPWRLFSSPNIQKFELEKNAKLTDSLYCFGLSGYNNFLVSPKFKDLLERHRLMGHQFIESIVYGRKKTTYNYYFFHNSDLRLPELVDYQKSTVYSTEWLNNNTRKPITLQNFEEYKYLMSLDKEAKMDYHLDQIALSESFDHELDLFNLFPLDCNCYISERLKNAIEEAGITGVKMGLATNFL